MMIHCEVKNQRAIAILAVVLISMFLAGAQSGSADWDSCHDDLDSARRAAADAADAAQEAHSKRTDFEDCKGDPETYDLMGDGCRSLRADYDSAASDAESALDDLDNRLHSVQDACGFEFTLNKLSPAEAAQKRLDSANRRLCASYQNFLPSLSVGNVLDMCKRNRPEDWCKACLGTP